MKVETIAANLGRKIKATRTFKANGTFKAFHEAEQAVSEMGFVSGSMQRNAPIGLMDSETCCSVSKWRNMSDTEHTELDGLILSDDFREGDVVVVMFMAMLPQDVS